MERTLDEFERRVLGVLLEKALAQPSYYPMTVNAIVAACNQKNNRDPVMELDEDAVLDTLEGLRERGLVTRIMPGAGSRTNRYRHEVASAESGFGWSRPEQAVMAELLLRGPQTLGELRTRCSRMVPLESLESVSAVLDGLATSDRPWASAMPRVPGHSAVRHTHLLYPEADQPDTGSAAVQVPTPGAAGVTPAPAPAPAETDTLRGQVEALKAEVAELRQELAALKERIATLENQAS
ncbi:MAG: YceH family protein [Planctomycetota bacterium]